MAPSLTCPNCGTDCGPNDIDRSGASFDVNVTFHCPVCNEVLDKDKAKAIYNT